MSDDLQASLEVFARVEANLIKLEGVWKRLIDLMPVGVAFGTDTVEAKTLRLAFADICSELPPIDGVTIDPDATVHPDEAARARFDAMELGDLDAKIRVEDYINRPGDLIEQYRVRLARSRRALVVVQIRNVVDRIDAVLAVANVSTDGEASWPDGSRWNELRQLIREVDQLAGTAVARRARWTDLHRHLSFAEPGDLRDIVNMDWPSVRAELEPVMHNELEPLPLGRPISDLSALTGGRPLSQPSAGPKPLRWDVLTDEDFERLVYVLMQQTHGFVDVSWIMPTRAADRGRDIQAYQIVAEPLMPTRRIRIIVQCKHWRARSVSLDDISDLMTRMPLWEPPKVEVVVIATSGRFTLDAVQWIESREESRDLPRVVPWPENQIEMMLASHQDLIATFGLR